MKVYAAIRDRTRDYSATCWAWGAVGIEVSWRPEIERWPQTLRDEWEERAAIIEFDGGEPRPVAERAAYIIVREAHEVEAIMRRGAA